MIRENKIKKMLREGKNVVGTFIKCCDPAVIEVISAAGFDFVIIDNEHTAMNKENMVNLIRASDITGIVPIVRVRENTAVEILQALDAGALGVQVPMVNTREQAQSVVNSTKYFPVGNRGYAASQRSAGYGIMNPTEYAEISNQNTIVACYCETAECIKNLDDILKVEELDVVFIGPFDLSQALGVIGNPNHPVVQESIDNIIKKVRSAGKVVGIIASDSEQAQKWFDKGVQYVCLSSDLGMILGLGKKFIGELKK